jgi:hypothetical protein
VVKKHPQQVVKKHPQQVVKKHPQQVVKKHPQFAHLLKFLTLTRMSARLHQLTKVQTETPAIITMNLQLQR